MGRGHTYALKAAGERPFSFSGGAGMGGITPIQPGRGRPRGATDEVRAQRTRRFLELVTAGRGLEEARAEAELPVGAAWRLLDGLGVAGVAALIPDDEAAAA